jgi:hypothetical protein
MWRVLDKGQPQRVELLPSVDRSKAASRGRGKTGQLSGTQDGVVYPARPSERKRSVRSLVRQLLGPHLST